jgi:hypothetical protein
VCLWVDSMPPILNSFHKRVFFVETVLQDSADVQRSALNVIVNCVCAPVSRPGGVTLIPRIQGSSTKKKFSGKTSEEHINKVKK